MSDSVIDLCCHDTSPGAKSVFAPPAGWSGDDEAYLRLMQVRYKTSVAASKKLWMIARLDGPVRRVRLTGPYAGVARRIVESIKARIAKHHAA